jgi:hypothetical protein
LPVIPTPETAMPSTSAHLERLFLVLVRAATRLRSRVRRMALRWMALTPGNRRALLGRLTILKRSSRLLELRSPQRAGTGVEEHVLADEAFGAADRHLQGGGARLARMPVTRRSARLQLAVVITTVRVR